MNNYQKYIRAIFIILLINNLIGMVLNPIPTLLCCFIGIGIPVPLFTIFIAYRLFKRQYKNTWYYIRFSILFIIFYFFFFFLSYSIKDDHMLDDLYTNPIPLWLYPLINLVMGVLILLISLISELVFRYSGDKELIDY